MSMIDSLKNIFSKGGNKKVTKIYRLPEDNKEMIDKVIDRKLANVLAENYKLKEQLKILEDKLSDKEDKEFENIKEKAKELYKIQKEKESKKHLKMKLILDKDDELPKFFLKSNKVFDSYKYFWGIDIYETDDGYIVWYPLLTDGKKVVRFKRPARDFKDFFKEKIGIVQQIKGGKLDSNFDLDEYGNPVLLLDDRGESYDSDTKIKVVNLADQERFQYEQQIAQLKDMINKLYTELEEAKKREVEYKNELKEKEVALSVSQYEKDILNSNSIQIMNKQMAMFKQLTDSLLTVQDTKLQQILTEDMVDRLRMALDVARDELDEYRTQTPDEYKEKVQSMYNEFISKIDKVNTKLNMLMGAGGGKNE